MSLAELQQGGDGQVTAWINPARNLLLRRRSRERAWGYRPESEAFVEPTALVGLALLASSPDALSDGLARDAADWLAAIQRPDGALGLSAGIPAPCWGTPYAILLWGALGDYETERKRAVAWLLQSAGETCPADPHGVLSHDTGIVGWPWVEETHSWLEPTAMALLALRREGYERHPRVREGLRLICDRAVPGGAWNFGNRTMFGAVVPPQPAPTGMALAVLAGTRDHGELIEGGCRYLHNTLPRVRAPRSLAWGLIGLDAWQRRPAAGDTWLAESFTRAEHTGANTADLAQLLLAASRPALGLLAVGAFERSPVR